MNVLDWLILIIVVLSTALAAAQGFFFELFSLAGAIAGYLVAAWFYARLATVILPYVKAEWTADIVSFLAIFFTVLILASIVARLARWMVGEAGLRWFDRLLGGAFGVMRGTVVVTVLLLAMAAFSPQSSWLTNSQLSPYFLLVGRGIVWVAPTSVRQHFFDGVAALRGLRPSSRSEQDGAAIVPPPSTTSAHAGE
jgi:membrane protein required for colicin V production